MRWPHAFLSLVAAFVPLATLVGCALLVPDNDSVAGNDASMEASSTPGDATTSEDAVTDTGSSSDVLQFGDDSQPTLDAGSVSIAALYAGGENACVRCANGDVYCWGNNGYGQLGASTSSQFCNGDAATGEQCEPPTRIASLHGASLVGIGQNFLCALVQNRIRCLGKSDRGQLGPGNGGPSGPNEFGFPPPAVPSTTSGSLALGREHACVIVVSGGLKRVYCWGDDREGQLGRGFPCDGGSCSTSTPEIIEGYDNALQLAVGDSHTCVRQPSDIACWGKNDWAQMGDGLGDPNVYTPKPPNSEPTGESFVAAGYNHNCVLATNGIYCWGANDDSQAGQQSSAAILEVVTATQLGNMPTSDPPVELTGGAAHSCARTASGAVWCWGDDEQLLHLVTANSAAPVKVSLPGGANAAQIAAGGRFTCVLSAPHDKVWCWGRNNTGQLGQDGNPAGIVPVANLCTLP